MVEKLPEMKILLHPGIISLKRGPSKNRHPHSRRGIQINAADKANKEKAGAITLLTICCLHLACY